MLRVAENTEEQEASRGALDELLREGARRMLAQALEVEDYLERHRDERDAEGHAQVVGNGKAQPRKVTTGCGTLEIQASRVHDRRPGEQLRSTIFPPYMRRAPKLTEVLPVLYLRGLSTGDFKPALDALLGSEATGWAVADDDRPADGRVGARPRSVSQAWSFAIFA
jgi:transposase-like protein